MTTLEFYYFMLGFMSAVPDYKLLTIDELNIIKTKLKEVKVQVSLPEYRANLYNVDLVDYNSYCYPQELTLADYTLGDR